MVLRKLAEYLQLPMGCTGQHTSGQHVGSTDAGQLLQAELRPLKCWSASYAAHKSRKQAVQLQMGFNRQYTGRLPVDRLQMFLRYSGW